MLCVCACVCVCARVSELHKSRFVFGEKTGKSRLLLSFWFVVGTFLAGIVRTLFYGAEETSLRVRHLPERR